VLVVEESVDRLEALRAATRDSHVFYLIGAAEVLPLTDASVDEIAAELEELTEEAAMELFRVLRHGGTITVAGSSSAALNSERMLAEAGFTDVAAAANARGSLTARKP
jgi:hypothetical protein